MKVEKEVLFSKRIERPITGCDQAIDSFTMVELLKDKNPTSICKLAVRITWCIYDVHVNAYDRFTITLMQFEEAVKNLKEFQDHISNRNGGISQEINGVIAFTQAVPHIMNIVKLNGLLITDRDFTAHQELFDKVITFADNQEKRKRRKK